MTLNINKPLQIFVLMLSVFLLLAFIPQQAEARKGDRKAGKTQTSVNKKSTRNSNKNTSKNSNKNVNVNKNSNKNVNVDVDVDVDRHGNRHGNRHGRHHNDNNFATGLFVGLVVGSVVASLPPSGCTTVIQNGITYSQCGSHLYQPQYSGSSVTYIVVQ